MRTNRNHRRPASRLRAGFSLIEMVVAAALMIGTVAPTLAVIRNAMAQSRELHDRHLLANYAVQIMEAQAGVAAADWTSETLTGDWSADGHGQIRYTVTKSDNPSDGGIVNKLMSIEVTAFEDADGDTNLDANEMQETYRTKVAKLNTYENEE
jgi:type II secretory pathway pseudopilin PulG